MTSTVSVSSAAEIQALLDKLVPATKVRVGSALLEKSFPKREQVDLYRVDLSDPAGRRTRRTSLAVQRLPDDRRKKALERLRRAAERLRRIDSGCVAVYGEVPAEKLLLYSFPLDPKLERLGEAVSSGHVAAKLDALGWGAGLDVGPIEVEVVRYVPARRCQVRWRTSGVDGKPAEIYAKAYRDARGAEVFDAMRQLHDRLTAEAPADISTPAPVAYVPEWNALLQRAAPGITLHSLCGSGQAEESAFELAGRALAAFHAEGIELARTHSADDELGVAYHSASLAAQRQHRYGKLLGWLEELQTAAESGSTVRLSVVHRDCYDRQFLIDGKRVAIIDLDDLALGEPELDAANFMAHIELRAIQGLISAGGMRTSFLEGYRRAGRRRLDDRRLRFYLATALIRLTSLYSMRPGETASSDELFSQAGDAVSAVMRQTKCGLMP